MEAGWPRHIWIAAKFYIILPVRHHIATLLIQHHHERVSHQGHLLMKGNTYSRAVVDRWQDISSLLHQCVTERLSTSPPFIYLGLDVFGPWTIHTRCTRGGQAFNKCWATLFTCMSTHAIHIEVTSSMDSSSCINEIHGPAKHLHSNCGTNFVRACRELQFQKMANDHTSTVKVVHGSSTLLTLLFLWEKCGCS